MSGRSLLMLPKIKAKSLGSQAGNIKYFKKFPALACPKSSNYIEYPKLLLCHKHYTMQS